MLSFVMANNYNISNKREAFRQFFFILTETLHSMAAKKALSVITPDQVAGLPIRPKCIVALMLANDAKRLSILVEKVSLLL